LILEPLEDRTVPGFLAPVSYPVDTEPSAVAVADFNGDGKPDLVTANSPYGSDVSVLLGNGDGTFQPARNFAAAPGPMVALFPSVAVGDFNGDGKPDIVETTYSGVSILLGNGDGTFQPPLAFQLPLRQLPLSVAVADLNGDGKPDLVVTGTNSYLGPYAYAGPSGANYVNVMLGNGDGTFSDASTVKLPSVTLPQPVALADFNGDGKPDVVTTTTNAVAVLLNNGNGTLAAPTIFATDERVESVAVGDFNGDGKLDLVTSNYTTQVASSISVLMGNGDGTFQTARNLLPGLSPAFVAVGDFNRDGRADLAVPNAGPNGTGAYLSILLSNGDGTFQSPLNYPAGSSPWSVAAGDFNGDGIPDLAVANNGPNTVSVLLDAADWSLPQATSFAVSFPSPVTAGTSGSLTVTAKLADGSTDIHYIGTVLFSSSDSQAVLPADYTFTAADAGVHTFSTTLKTAGTHSITATDYTSGSITATDAAIIVTPAAASTLSVTGFPSFTMAGVPGSFTVVARDPYSNIASGYTGTIHFTSSDDKASLPANYTFTAADAGIHTFSATLKTAGQQSITATDTMNGNLTATDSGMTVSPAAASQFIISAPASVIAGAPFSLTLTVEDAYGNVVTNYAGTIHFSSTDRMATLPKNYTFTAADKGVHTFTGLVLRTRGFQKITITDKFNSSLFDNVIVDVL
jgi:hypothetical protein